jgi:hypothetical protein
VDPVEVGVWSVSDSHPRVMITRNSRDSVPRVCFSPTRPRRCLAFGSLFLVVCLRCLSFPFHVENPRKVRTAKAERRTFGRFFFRFPNGEAGLDVYNRASSFLATLARDIRQIDERYYLLHPEQRQDPTTRDAMANMNILVVTHGLTLRLILMRYFQLSVEEFENSYNSQNARLVTMDRCVDKHGREYYRLHEAAKEALNFMGDVSNELPVYWRHEEAGMGDSLFIPMQEEDDEE